ncbi:hypothetical protein ASE74_20015 [Pedobacter sp. Leaf216]|uniref:class I SAM-dependent methyltransferase n=1 Tax=Pedobacter sp. Leaf216 TaxID=1735684 RepID=UPI0006F83480|nr:class I SAM-dependent methyltransferase [Pedobacter sp. Leaf216]KQM76333.1 hypothetical protein ASE74_20015 [Pedobacter sp. Leaf216]
MDEQTDITAKGKQMAIVSKTGVKDVEIDTPLPKNKIVFKLIHELELEADTKVLEIGAGDGEHLPFLFQKITESQYYSASISEIQLQQALSSNVLTNKEKWRQFIRIEESGKLGFEDHFFSYCFSVNSLYFWKNPVEYFKEIYRVLTPGGRFDLAFIEKKFGGDLPWTQMDFTFYETDQVQDFFYKAGFTTFGLKKITEEITDKQGKIVTRPVLILSGCK